MTSSLTSAPLIRGSTPAARSPVGGALRGKALEIAAQLLLVAAIPRVLGPSDYGVFALALSVVTLGSVSMSVGGPTLMSRFVPAVSPAERGPLARAMFLRLARWRACAMGAAIVAAVALTVASPSTFPPVIALLIAGALVFDVAATLAFQAALALGHTTAWSFRFATQNAVVIVAVLAGYALAGVDGAVAGVAVGSGVSLAWSAALVGRPLLEAEGGASVPEAAVRFGVMQALANSFVQFTHRGAIVAVAVLAGSSVQTGFSALAVGIGLAGTYAVWQLFTVQLPGLVDATRDAADVSLANPSLRRLGAISLAGALVMALAGVALLQVAVPIVFGDRFEGASEASAVALAVLPLAPLTAIVTQTAALRLQPGLRAFASGAGLVAFATTAALTIPAWGATGGSAALLAGTVATVLASAVAFPTATGGRLLAAALAGSAMVLGLAHLTGAI